MKYIAIFDLPEGYKMGCVYSENGICTNDELWIAEEGVCGCFKEVSE